MTTQQQISISDSKLELSAKLVKLGLELKSQEHQIFDGAKKEKRGLNATEYKAYKKVLHQQSFIYDLLGQLDDISVELF